MKANTPKKLFILTFLTMLLFSACSEKSATKYSKKSPQYAQLAKYTKIAKIVQDDEVKAIANITYLNGANKKAWDDGYQYFIVGVYGFNETTTPPSLKMLSKEKLISSIKETKIENSDPLFEDIPFKNNWALYQKVKYIDIKEDDTIVLRFMLDGKNYSDITFEKSKY